MSMTQDEFNRAERMLDLLGRMGGLQDALELAVAPVVERLPADRQRMIDALLQAGRDQRAAVEAEVKAGVAVPPRARGAA